MTSFKLTRTGNPVGAILPEGIPARLKLEKGDTVFVTDAPGGVTLTPRSGPFGNQMSAARRIMKKRRDVLRERAR
jgi:putative addiction module antidote